MLSLAALRYRNVLSEHAGPVERIETGVFYARGREMVLANATLRPGLLRKGPLCLYSDADGTGTHRIPAIARHKAVSEAMERWAFSATVRSERAADFGFDVDPSSNGMSAFPGLLRRQARKASVLEGVERFCVMAWWEGLLPGRTFDTDWPGVSAVAIDGPFGGVTVIVYAKSDWGGYVYGHAAEESFGAACERAVMELARHEWILRSHWLTRASGTRLKPTNIFEQRCLYFAGEVGHALFLSRVGRRGVTPRVAVDVVCDREIPGPWDQYATVWRFALRPPSDGYRRGGESYFFL